MLSGHRRRNSQRLHGFDHKTILQTQLPTQEQYTEILNNQSQRREPFLEIKTSKLGQHVGKYIRVALRV
jgi:hypothetical protein